MIQKLIYIGQNDDLAYKLKEHLSTKGVQLELFKNINNATEALKNGHIGAILDVRGSKNYSQEDIINEQYEKIFDLRNKTIFPVLGILSGTEESGYNTKTGQNGLWISYVPVDKREIDTFVKYALGPTNMDYN